MQLSFTMWAYRYALPIHVHTCWSSYSACASDTSQSTYGIEQIEVKDMHLYILCRSVVLRKTQLVDIYNCHGIQEGLLRGLSDLC